MNTDAVSILYYDHTFKTQWNDCVLHSVNGTFLWQRDFMEYHNDRFKDASLMLFDDYRCIACVPACVDNGHWYSHKGLTYGGVAWNTDQSNIPELLSKLTSFLEERYSKITFRAQPAIYNSYAGEEQAALIQTGFDKNDYVNNLYVDFKRPIKISSKKTTGYRNGKYDHLELRVESHFDAFFHKVLIPQLQARHQAQPVHSLQEMEYLSSLFPDHIKQYNVYRSGSIVAGVTFFLKSGIAKSQYAAATIEGMECGALNFLYLEAFEQFKKDGMDFMDFGHVNESDGSINRGLQRFKEELGGSNQQVFYFSKNV